MASGEVSFPVEHCRSQGWLCFPLRTAPVWEYMSKPSSESLSPPKHTADTLKQECYTSYKREVKILERLLEDSVFHFFSVPARSSKSFPVAPNFLLPAVRVFQGGWPGGSTWWISHGVTISPASGSSRFHGSAVGALSGFRCPWGRGKQVSTGKDIHAQTFPCHNR